MPLKLSPSIVETFALTEVDEKYETEGTSVTIKQAAMYEHERRSGLYAEMVSRVAQDGTTMEVVSRFSQPELHRIECMLTLVDCNIQDEDGEPLFKFTGKGADRRVSDETAFFKAWGKLPTFVADAIHDRVLKVNVGWGRLGEA